MRRDAAPLLSGAEREVYERDGVVCLRDLFSRDWLAFLADAIEEAMAHPGPQAEEYTPQGGAGRFFGDLELFQRLPKFRRFAMQPGDCLVFQAMIVHGAPGNSGRQRRRAISTRWAGDDARYCVRKGEVAIPTQDPGLAHGARLDSERFPLAWKA